MPYIVVIGNPIDGFTHHGPFGDFEEASEFGDSNMISSEWWAVTLNPPTKDE